MKTRRLMILTLGIPSLIALRLGDAVAEPSAEAYALLLELRELPAAIEPGGSVLSAVNEPPRIPPNKLKRDAVYSQLLELEQGAVLALARGLGDPDVRIRRQAALALVSLGGGFFSQDDERQPALNIVAALGELEMALRDSDSRVRELSAQAIGSIGSSAASTVPELIELLQSESEGDRNTAAIGLRGIGLPARDALPALNAALSDPSRDVRNFARLAIESIGTR